MKKILMIVVMVFLMNGVAMGVDKNKVSSPAINEERMGIWYDDSDIQIITAIWVTPKGKKRIDGYLSVKTKSGNEYRIYPCGKVDKLIWKEINPNEDRDASAVYYWDGSDITPLVSSDIWQYHGGAVTLTPNTTIIR